MKDIGDLLIDSRTDDKFDRLIRGVLKKNKYTVVKRSSKDYYYIANESGETLGFDVSTEKFTFARNKSPDAADRLMERIGKNFGILERLVSFTNAQEFLRFTVMRNGELGKGMIAEPFIGELNKVMCYTADNVTACILNEKYMKKWDVPREVLFSVADHNMCRLLRRTEFSEEQISSAPDIRYLDFKAEGNDFTAALIMCSAFHDHIAGKLGTRFLAAVPSKDSMTVMTEVNGERLARLGAAAAGEYRFAVRPLTADIFLYTSAGMQVAGHFSEIDAE